MSAYFADCDFIPSKEFGKSGKSLRSIRQNFARVDNTIKRQCSPPAARWSR